MSRELEALHRQLGRLDDLQQQLKTVNRNIGIMESKLPELEQNVRDEQSDVDRMESGGISSFVYGILGRQEEKLEKERLEAKQAQEQYQAALNTLQELHRQRESIVNSIAQMEDFDGSISSSMKRSGKQFCNPPAQIVSGFSSWKKTGGSCTD